MSIPTKINNVVLLTNNITTTIKQDNTKTNTGKDRGETNHEEHENSLTLSIPILPITNIRLIVNTTMIQFLMQLETAFIMTINVYNHYSQLTTPKKNKLFTSLIAELIHPFPINVIILVISVTVKLIRVNLALVIIV